MGDENLTVPGIVRSENDDIGIRSEIKFRLSFGAKREKLQHQVSVRGLWFVFYRMHHLLELRAPLSRIRLNACRDLCRFQEQECQSMTKRLPALSSDEAVLRRYQPRMEGSDREQDPNHQARVIDFLSDMPNCISPGTNS